MHTSETYMYIHHLSHLVYSSALAPYRVAKSDMMLATHLMMISIRKHSDSEEMQGSGTNRDESRVAAEAGSIKDLTPH